MVDRMQEDDNVESDPCEEVEPDFERTWPVPVGILLVQYGVVLELGLLLA